LTLGVKVLRFVDIIIPAIASQHVIIVLNERYLPISLNKVVAYVMSA